MANSPALHSPHSSPRGARTRQLDTALIEALLLDVTAALRQRTLVSCLDWSAANAHQIARLLDGASCAGRAPTWLLQLALTAGHPLSEEHLEDLSPEARALSLLNERADACLPVALEKQLAGRCRTCALEAPIVAALVGKLTQGAHRDLACRLALAIWSERPDAIKPVKHELEAFVAMMPPATLRVTGFSTTDTLAGALRRACSVSGLNARIEMAPHGAVQVELMDSRAHCDALILLLDPQSQLEVDWRLSAAERLDSYQERVDALCSAIDVYCRRSSTPLLVNTLPAAIGPHVGHFDAVDPAGAAYMTRQMNERLARLASTLPALQLIDADYAMRGLAPDARHDQRLWLYGRIAYSEPAVRKLAMAFAQAMSARARGPAKVLALDFDDTLWGGVFGDDGVSRLACGDDPPGNAFRAFQHECLRLKAQGILLVGLSKNNEDVLEVFGSHTSMVLRKDDFVATAINWAPKGENIRRLSRELDLGLDSFVFLDDNPHEREAMRILCPEVFVPELPADPAARATWLRQLGATWALRPTEEDQRRTDMYRAVRDAKALQANSGTYEDYLLALRQTLTVETLTERTLARAAQLHQRTNQYNLTTRRFGEAELAGQMATKGSAVVLLGSAKDRLGDHGIIAASVIAIDGSAARIDSFLMSCRVIARSVETAFLGSIIKYLLERGVERIEGEYKPTPKNDVVRDFYCKNGFLLQARDSDGTERWLWTVSESTIPVTPYVTVTWSTP
ncbi:MAG: HAD-IIIC family phosphatase [Hyphomicrobiales bacterium]|nr:MAG: HAD-IIIC family phosphatase [Hyphomicrobiales bacterium]